MRYKWETNKLNSNKQINLIQAINRFKNQIILLEKQVTDRKFKD